MKRTRVEVITQSKGPGDVPNLEFVINRGSHTALVRQYFDERERCTVITRRVGKRYGKEWGVEERFDLTLTEKK